FNFDANIFYFAEKFNAVTAAFTPDATLFKSAKRHAKITDKPVIHPNRSGTDGMRDPMSTLQIFRPYDTVQSIFDIIRNRQSLLFRIKRYDGDDRTENFFLADSRPRIIMDINGRL